MMKNRIGKIRLTALVLMALIAVAEASPQPSTKGKGAANGGIQVTPPLGGEGEASGEATRQFRRVDTSSNLSGDYVRSIVRDRYGALWLLMMTHVERYDGHRFHHYEVNGMPQGGDALHDLALTADGRLWITGTQQNYVYREREDCIQRAEASDFAAYDITDPVSTIYVDSRQDLWCRSVAGSDEILLHYNFATRQLTRTDVGGAGTVIGLALVHDNAYVLTATEDSACAIWTAGQGRRTLTPVVRIPVRPSERTRIYADRSGRLWLYALNETCLWLYDTRTAAVTDVTARLPLDGFMMTALIDDGDGNLWIGTGNHGISMLGTAGTIDALRQDDGAPFQLADNHINCFYHDSETATMWVGTSKQGLVYCNQALTSVSIAHMPADEDVSCLDADPDGQLWMGFDSQGAASTRPGHTSHASSFTQGTSLGRLTTTEGGLASNQVVCTLRDSRGRRWWGSYGGELLYMDADGHPHPIRDSRLHQVISLQEDDEGRIWVGTFYDGVYALDPESSATVHAITPHDGVLRSGCISQLQWDSSHQRLYIGTNDGLYVLDVESGDLRCLMEGTNIRAILLTADSGMLWVGLDTGLTACNPESGEVLCALTTRDGLSHNTIFALVEDAHGSVWASTKHGVSCITPSSSGYRCTSLGDEDGLGSICFNPRAATRLADGTILMGALGTVVSITPRPDMVSPLIPLRTYFTTLFLNGERVGAGIPLSDGRVILSKNLLMTNRLELRHSDSSVSIEVSDMNVLFPHQRYEYRLGREGAWHELEGHTVTLNDLQPGTYLLQARTSGTSTNAPEQDVATLTLRITPPWYLTTLALISYALLIAFAVVALIVRSRHRATQRATKQQREMAIQQRLQMDEAKMRFFTNVSHDMRTPLSLIVTPLSRLLQRDDLDDEMRNQLQLINPSADTLQEEITQLLDYRRLDQTPGTLTLSDGSLRDFIQSVCQPFIDADLQGGVTLEVALPDDDDMMTRFDRAKVKRIVTNLISNAIKYNKPAGRVRVALRRDGTHAVISVSDQGIGIRPENRERIFERFFQESHGSDGDTYTGSGIGLHLVKQYITMLGGTVAVSSAVPEGSVFTVRLPLHELESGDRNDEEREASPKSSPEGFLPPDNGGNEGGAKTIEDFKSSLLQEGKGEALGQAAPGHQGSPRKEQLSPAVSDSSDTRQEATDLPDEDASPSPDLPLLVVEDNDDFRTFLQSCLTGHYRVVTAANGREALAVLERQEVRLIISDVMMPVMDGMVLCRRVKGDIRYSHIPFIMLSARTADQQQAEGLSEGADDYITKPFNLDILLLRIGRLLHWAEGARERFQQIDVKPTELTVSRIDERLIAQAIEQVEAHIAEPDYSVEQLCAALAMSRSNLYKKLIAITGLAPLQFIRTLRIKRGRQLLEESGESVSQVAYRIGLSPKQFAKYFRETYGILPSDFRHTH